MKLILMFIFLIGNTAFAESPCDLKLGHSVGVRVVEFSTGNVIHSKMPLREMSASSLNEELVNLQDMGICEETIQAKKCVLRFEKKTKGNQLTLFRGQDRWISWGLNGKKSAQKFVTILKQAGFCS